MERSNFEIFRYPMILLLILFSLACNRDELKASSMAAFEILDTAKNMLKVRSAENLAENGNIQSTVVTFDNTSAKEYLESNENRLKKHYSTIERNYDPRDKKYVDALFMLTLINEMVFWLSGETLGPRCTYLDKIETADTTNLSEWMVNEVFAPFINKKNGIEKWKSMDRRDKIKDIREFLMVGYKEAGC